MAKELAEKAKEAFLDDDFDVAVDLYSKAIDLDPNCAAFFADRAQAYIKLDNFTGIRRFVFLLCRWRFWGSGFVWFDLFMVEINFDFFVGLV